MPFIKKSGVKNRISGRLRKAIDMDSPASRPDTTGFSRDEPGARKANLSDFAEDFQTEHSISGTALAPSEPLTGSFGPQAPAASKSAQV